MRALLLVGLVVLGTVLFLSPAAFSQPVFFEAEYLKQGYLNGSEVYDAFWDGPRKRLYFVRGGDIWSSDWLDTGWTADQKLGLQINTGLIERSPSLSPDEQKLYFTRRDSALNYDIWVSAFDSLAGDWGVPVNLGPPINTAGNEHSVELVPDGRLFFTSDNKIYASQWNGSSWSNPELQWDQGASFLRDPSVTADGQWMFFEDLANIMVTRWTDSGWETPAYPLFAAGGFDWYHSPFISPSGDSLFYTHAWDDSRVIISLAWRVSRGDMNLDGGLSAADVVTELNRVFLADFYYTDQAGLGDMNCDRQYTPADAVLLLNAVMLGGPGECWSTLPPPGQE